MPRLIKPPKVKIVPRDGELEVTINININIDGQVTALSEKVIAEKEEDKVDLMIPDFSSNNKLNFGKPKEIK